MKRIKFLLPLIAIIFIAAGVFAMKASKKVTNTHIFADGYYEFNGDATKSTDRLNPSLYDYVGPTAPASTSPCANGETTLCGIYTEGNGVNPVIPATGDIHDALQNNEPLVDQVYLHN